MFSVLIATCSSDMIVTLRRGPYNAVTQLRVNPSCKPSFLEVHLARGCDFLGANSCAPTSSHSPWECIYLSLVPCTWFSPGRGPPHGSYLSQGFPVVAWVLHELGYSLLVLGLMALKPPFSFLSYCSELSRPEASLRRLSLAMPYPGDAFLRRCLSKATPPIGDALTWRCLKRSIY